MSLSHSQEKKKKKNTHRKEIHGICGITTKCFLIQPVGVDPGPWSLVGEDNSSLIHQSQLWPLFLLFFPFLSSSWTTCAKSIRWSWASKVCMHVHWGPRGLVSCGAQRRTLVSAWQEKGNHTGLSLARGSLAWEGWGGRLCGWAAWVRSWRLSGERRGSVWERDPVWGVMARQSEEGVSSSQGCYSVKDSKARAEWGRRPHGVLGEVLVWSGSPVGWGGCPDRSWGGGMKWQGLSWVNRVSMW